MAQFVSDVSDSAVLYIFYRMWEAQLPPTVTPEFFEKNGQVCQLYTPTTYNPSEVELQV
jgi:hypothetical protein